MRKEVENWWQQSKDDFDSAKYNFEGSKYYLAAFMCQQAVEKALKALYIKKYNELAKVHDLVFLAKKLNLPEEVILICDKLTQIYIETRYPVDGVIPAKRFSKNDVKQFIKITREVLECLKKLI